MTHERWVQIDSIAQRALELDDEDRATFIRAACAGDIELLKEVEHLLRSVDEGEHLIGESVTTFAAPMLEELFGQQELLEQVGPGRTAKHSGLIRGIGRRGTGEAFLAIAYRAGEFVRSDRLLIALSLLVVVALIAGLVAWAGMCTTQPPS